MWITNQDQGLFRYLYENKVALAKQIQRDIYCGYSLRSVNNRLGKMIKKQYVHARQHRELGSRMVYSLDALGFRKFIKPLGNDSLRQELESSVVRHDLNLLEIRKRLETCAEIKQYFTENLIAANGLYDEDEFFGFSFLKPDAIVKLASRSGKVFNVAIEYESARKYADRYEALFRNYYARNVPGVLYICKDDALLKRIRSIEMRTIEQEVRKFYYSDFSKWKKNKFITFTNLNDSQILLYPMTCSGELEVSPHHQVLNGASRKPLKSEETAAPAISKTIAD